MSVPVWYVWFMDKWPFINVSGEKNANKKALEMILSKIQEDPQSASCLNISYGDVQGLVANPNPTGSPFATVAQSSERSVKGAVVLPNTPFSLNLGNGRALDLRFNSVPGKDEFKIKDKLFK